MHNASKYGDKSKKKTPSERAEEKRYPGIKNTSNGGPDFAGTDYIYKNGDTEAVVKIKMTGSRGRDYIAAFNKAGIPKNMRKELKKTYTWHHVDDFDPITGECTMQLVLSDAHVATYFHKGSVYQYEQFFNVKYK